MNDELHSLTDLDSMINRERAVLVYFYSNNCAPCLSLRPKVEDMINTDFKMMGLVFINSETHPEITGSFGVFANPTLIIFLEGKEYKRESKYIGIAQLKETIARPYNLMFN